MSQMQKVLHRVSNMPIPTSMNGKLDTSEQKDIPLIDPALQLYSW